MRTPAWEAWLRFGVLAGIGLLLLTPFVVSQGTIFPFVVGKAVWSRSVIEVVFALWAVLALANPACRPPRSWVLVALAAGLAVSLLAACFGASFQRSLWSSYERMQGVVDGAHWMALAVVLVSVLRSGAAWRRLLMASAGAGAAMACLVIARHYEMGVPFYGAMAEQHLPRMSGPLGNPIYLSVYLLVNLMLALGLAVRAWLIPAPPATSAAAPTARAGHRRGASARGKAPPESGARPAPGRLAGLAWAVAAGLQLWGLALAGSVGGFAGLFAALAFVAVAAAFLARRRARRIAVGVLAALAVLAIWAGTSFFHPDRTMLPGIKHPAVRYVASVHIQRPGIQSRLAAWEAGLEGFAARPVLGWGPENFVAVFGRYASGYGAVTEPHDQAHGKLVEVAATTGAAGVAAYLGLWVLALLAVWRAARGMGAGERALALGVGGALAGTLAQSQFVFDTPAGSLQTILLLGFAAGLEARAFAESHRPRLPARLSARCAAAARGTPRADRARGRGGRARGRRADGASGDSRRRGCSASADEAGVLERHGGRHRGLPAARQHLALGAVRRARPSLAAAPGRERPRRPGPARLGVARGGGGGAHGAAELAHPAEPGADVPRRRRDRPGIRGAGTALPRTRAGARSQPRGVSGRAAPAGRPRIEKARRRPPRAALAVARRRGIPRRGGVPPGRLLARPPARLRPGADLVRPARGSLARKAALPRQGLPTRPRMQRLGRVAGARAGGGREPPGRRRGAGTVTGRERYKRPFDLALVALALVLAGPLWLALGVAIALAIRIEGGGPVLYRQPRLGRDGRVFRMLKFRTMVENAEERTGPTWAAWRDARSTAVGRVLRRYHLDELPQLVNVLRGEMSLVGPRPERPALAARIGRTVPGFESRLRVGPGIAGLAQWRGGHPICPRHKLRYDNLYIARMGPWLDLRLCAACVYRALRPSAGRAARRGRTVRPRRSDAWQEASRVRDVETGQ